MPPVNLRHDAYDVYIGRPGPWRNPFRIGPDGNRAKVIAKYARWLLQQVRQGKITTQQLAGLHGVLFPGSCVHLRQPRCWTQLPGNNTSPSASTWNGVPLSIMPRGTMRS